MFGAAAAATQEVAQADRVTDGGIKKEVCTLIGVAAPVVVDAFGLLCDECPDDTGDVCKLIVDAVNSGLTALCALEAPQGVEVGNVEHEIEALMCKALAATRFAKVTPADVQTDCKAITARHPHVSMHLCEEVFTELAKIDAACPAVSDTVVDESVVAGAGPLRSGAVALDWSACGNPAQIHGTVTSMEPTTLELGQETTLVVKGKLDESVQGGKYTVKAKVGWFSVFSHSGDVCTPEVIRLPFGLGQIKWDGMSCPVSQGPMSVSLQVSLSGSIPSWLAHGTITFEATSTSGDEVACLKITTAPAGAAFQVV